MQHKYKAMTFVHHMQFSELLEHATANQNSVGKAYPSVPSVLLFSSSAMLASIHMCLLIKREVPIGSYLAVYTDLLLANVVPSRAIGALTSLCSSQTACFLPRCCFPL